MFVSLHVSGLNQVANFVKSARGTDVLLYNGFRHYRNGGQYKQTSYWRCAVCRCRVTTTLVNGIEMIKSSDNRHNH